MDSSGAEIVIRGRKPVWNIDVRMKGSETTRVRSYRPMSKVDCQELPGRLPSHFGLRIVNVAVIKCQTSEVNGRHAKPTRSEPTSGQQKRSNDSKRSKERDPL